MAARFRVSVEEASSAIREARDLHQAATDSDEETGAVALDAVAGRIRAQGARRMGRHVSVIQTAGQLSDLVVPDDLRIQLEEIVAWRRSSHRVRWAMDLGTRDPVGTGLTCPDGRQIGTGKTFAARCLAAGSGSTSIASTSSRVVSSIGETEKALAQVFDEVEAGHGLLLFDGRTRSSADARRSRTRDRYANIGSVTSCSAWSRTTGSQS
jgi:SpoVK/Ycf46/Vps4 family AAA+-type ATPase